MSKSIPFFYDSRKKTTIELRNEMVFGRNKECDVSVVDHRVSGMHFKVHIKDDEVFLIDLESSNKTKLNGDSVSPKEEHKLKVKDTIKFGDQKFLYFFEDISNFSEPEVTTTLQISSTADCAEDLFKSSSLEFDGAVNLRSGKKVTMSDLRASKKVMKEAEATLKSASEEFEDFSSLKVSYDELINKINNSKQQLEIAKYDDVKSVEKDLESYNFSISELNESINDAKQKIETWNKQIAIINQSILKVKHFQTVFEDLKSFEIQEKELEKEIETKSSLGLEIQAQKAKAELDKATASYKEIQENYSNALEVKAKRAA